MLSQQLHLYKFYIIIRRTDGQQEEHCHNKERNRSNLRVQYLQACNIVLCHIPSSTERIQNILVASHLNK